MYKAAREYQSKEQDNQGLVGSRKPDVAQRTHVFKVAREVLGLGEGEEMEEVEVDRGDRVGRV